MKFSSFLLWLKYLYNAHTIYDLDSPFIVDLVQALNERRKNYYILSDIENLRDQIRQSKTTFQRTDLGAGTDHSKMISLKSSLKSSSSKYKCQILFRIAQWSNAKRILELGTHFGFGSIALSGGAGARIDTIEGDSFLIKLANENFKAVNCPNVKTHLGPFDEILPELLSTNSYDLIYIDGFHEFNATMRFTNTIVAGNNKNFIIIYDDIYWSDEMYQAWQKVKKLDAFNYSLEYMGFGLIGFNPGLKSNIHKIICPTIFKPFRFGFLRDKN